MSAGRARVRRLVLTGSPSRVVVARRAGLLPDRAIVVARRPAEVAEPAEVAIRHGEGAVSLAHGAGVVASLGKRRGRDGHERCGDRSGEELTHAMRPSSWI